ncbi:hypothetical protein [Radiobacillus sp. PE A8.2]
MRRCGAIALLYASITRDCGAIPAPYGAIIQKCGAINPEEWPLFK